MARREFVGCGIFGLIEPKPQKMKILTSFDSLIINKSHISIHFSLDVISLTAACAIFTYTQFEILEMFTFVINRIAYNKN